MHEPAKDTEEAKLIEILRNPKDWITLDDDNDKK